MTKRWIGVLLQRPHASNANQQSSIPNEVPRDNSPTMQSNDEEQVSPDPAPFTVADVIKVGSLADVLKKLIFKHPEIQTLRTKATAAAEAQQVLFDDDAGLVGEVYGHDEPLLPLRYFPKDDWDFGLPPLPPVSPEDVAIWEKYEEPLPTAITDCYDAINLRAITLFQMLQRRKVVGLGHTVDGHPVPLMPTIWSHEDFYIHPPTGDIYEAGPGEMTKRWTGVILVPHSGFPLAASAEPVGSIPTVVLDPKYFREPPSEYPTAQPPVAFHVELIASDGVLPTTMETKPASTKKSIAGVEVRKAARKACVAWLDEIMRTSPNERKESKPSLWKKAQKRWPRTLSERSFIAAWAEAINISGAVAWSAAGAPKKEKRK